MWLHFVSPLRPCESRLFCESPVIKKCPPRSRNWCLKKRSSSQKLFYELLLLTSHGDTVLCVIGTSIWTVPLTSAVSHYKSSYFYHICSYGNMCKYQWKLIFLSCMSHREYELILVEFDIFIMYVPWGEWGQIWLPPPNSGAWNRTMVPGIT